jgi:hypothetical protein
VKRGGEREEERGARGEERGEGGGAGEKEGGRRRERREEDPNLSDGRQDQRATWIPGRDRFFLWHSWISISPEAIFSFLPAKGLKTASCFFKNEF